MIKRTSTKTDEAISTEALCEHMKIIIDGEIKIIVSIRGRWVKLSDGTNISRLAAEQGHAEYLEDVALLGAEIENPEDDEAAPIEQRHDTRREEARREGDEAIATHYTGPMLALRDRVKTGKYKKAANGQPSCGDALARILGILVPAQVIRACLIALAYDANPYARLNIGQQSMNLRNRVRNALARGDFGMGVITEAVEEAQK